MTTEYRYSMYVFPDGVFTFHYAQYGSWANNEQLVFRVRIDTSVRDRVQVKGISRYDCIFPAHKWMVDAWMEGHQQPQYRLLTEIDTCHPLYLDFCQAMGLERKRS